MQLAKDCEEPRLSEPTTSSFVGHDGDGHELGGTPSSSSPRKSVFLRY